MVQQTYMRQKFVEMMKGAEKRIKSIVINNSKENNPKSRNKTLFYAYKTKSAKKTSAYRVTEINGTAIATTREGSTITRNISFFKKKIKDERSIDKWFAKVMKW